MGGIFENLMDKNDIYLKIIVSNNKCFQFQIFYSKENEKISKNLLNSIVFIFRR